MKNGQKNVPAVRKCLLLSLLFLVLLLQQPNKSNVANAQWILVRDGASIPSPYGIGTSGFYPSNSCVDRRPDCRMFENVCEHPGYKWYMDGCCKNTCDPECRRRDPADVDWEARRRRFRDQWSSITAGIGGGLSSLSTDGRYRDTERDIDRERRNNEAIRRKYLGQADLAAGTSLNYNGQQQQQQQSWPALRPGRVWDRPLISGSWSSPLGGYSPSVYPYGSQSSSSLSTTNNNDMTKWRDDNRWDRNDPSLTSRGSNRLL